MIKNHEGNPPALAPEGSGVVLKKVISYAGIDFYPLLHTRRFLELIGFKEGKIVKSFGVGGPGYEILSDIAIEPESAMVKFTTARKDLMRLPWSSLLDTIPTATRPCSVVGRKSGNYIPWSIWAK